MAEPSEILNTAVGGAIAIGATKVAGDIINGKSSKRSRTMSKPKPTRKAIWEKETWGAPGQPGYKVHWMYFRPYDDKQRQEMLGAVELKKGYYIGYRFHPITNTTLKVFEPRNTLFEAKKLVEEACGY